MAAEAEAAREARAKVMNDYTYVLSISIYLQTASSFEFRFPITFNPERLSLLQYNSLRGQKRKVNPSLG